jgi:hypothetical protein
MLLTYFLNDFELLLLSSSSSVVITIIISNKRFHVQLEHFHTHYKQIINEGPVWTAENLAPPGFDPRTVQPVVSRYTDRNTWPTC